MQWTSETQGPRDGSVIKNPVSKNYLAWYLAYKLQAWKNLNLQSVSIYEIQVNNRYSIHNV